jgi:hypothetical protein
MRGLLERPRRTAVGQLMLERYHRPDVGGVQGRDTSVGTVYNSGCLFCGIRSFCRSRLGRLDEKEC